ncbi:MAG TPA: RNA polymerase sigma factor [Parapedobacter sp.]|uniref:RNA polymerase sigma factor n=1 Tax=Parapedobacter sp. TaxID=1958893 RepID=UPI002C7D4C5A|nr:RNA polymerase sigma factor [Parapedobacter sp.]HWK57935.1 RNA polymerase sigma factor [Parapedobacter sp.]
MSFNIRYLKGSNAFSLESAVRRCAQKGDERSKEFIYKNCYGYLKAITMRYVKNEYDAEELTNESFIRAFGKMGTFRSNDEGERFEKSFRAWLARIAVNISIDFLRAQKQFVALDNVSEGEFDQQRVEVTGNLHVEDIMKLLFQLPEIQRTIFNLYEVEGYSHEEVSTLLGIPESTSRTYLTRAKKKLRKLYLASIDITARY